MRLDGTDDPWERWFAWYPVEIGNGIYWLQWVERRMSPDGPPPHDFSRMTYRLPSPIRQGDRG